MNCDKCKQVMRFKYVMDYDGTYKAVWICPDCGHEEFAIGRKC